MSLYRNKPNARQLIDFHGVSSGKLYPTDIDGIFELGNKLWIVFEIKHISANVPGGQNWLLERLTDNLETIAPTICIIAEHDTYEDVDLSTCKVRKFREFGKWHKPKKPTLFLAMWKEFIYETTGMSWEEIGNRCAEPGLRSREVS